MTKLDKIRARLYAAENASRGQLDAEATHEVMLTWNEESIDDMTLLLEIVDTTKCAEGPEGMVAWARLKAEEAGGPDTLTGLNYTAIANAWEALT